MPFQVDNIYSLLAVLIVTVVPTIPAILAFIQARRAASKVNETHIALVATQLTVEAVEKATNGMREQLEGAAHAAGVVEGTATEKARAEAEARSKLPKDST